MSKLRERRRMLASKNFHLHKEGANGILFEMMEIIPNVLLVSNSGD